MALKFQKQSKISLGNGGRNGSVRFTRLGEYFLCDVQGCMEYIAVSTAGTSIIGVFAFAKKIAFGCILFVPNSNKMFLIGVVKKVP